MEEKPNYAAGLDAGSLHTRFMMGVLEPSGLRLIGFGETESEGWVKGRIADQRAASESILRAVREAELKAQAIAESAVAGVGGPTVRGANSRAAIEVGRKREIEHRDVTRAIERASRVQLHEDRMMLQASLQDFVVDDHPGHRDPRGMIASRIEANMHLVTASVQEHECLVTAMNQAHLAAQETVYEGIAACYAAILPEERREGIALLYIGRQQTNRRANAGGEWNHGRDASAAEPDAGSARIVAFPAGPPRAGEGGDGPGADGRHCFVRRRRAPERHVRYGRARSELPGAERTGAGDTGLAGRD